jgi:hypothetical protein
MFVSFHRSFEVVSPNPAPLRRSHEILDVSVGVLLCAVP